ncbi:MAG: chromosome segregation protein SMC [Rhizobiales bacterium]|nr:chromosome segregation protein SMC [Hyphomicrobiales bacterium]
MKFHKLRIAGFKSFCEATDFVIEPGLTGVVGPNGCGKSNLVEAMRWVMGENSTKNMRASGMDDVIFSGSGNRPARNTAEVALVLDNADRTAPAAFNDAEILEVSRKIEREEGSTYRVNGREVRARDVQLLFADASTGARSPAMVRQGQIGELINAKPQARRRILEEAAGVAGLHSRRHEAELRLKAAEDNLVRLEDVLKQIEAQADSLKRQARQASRYKSLAADIRRQEALVLFVGHREAQRGLIEAVSRFDADTREVAERTRLQGEAARLQALAAHALPGLRENEARAGAVLQRLVLAREALEGEERRAKERAADLDRRIAQAAQDLAREKALIEDARGVLERLAAEAETLAGEAESSAETTEAAQERLILAEEALAGSERRLADAQAALSDINARRNALESALREDTQRAARVEGERARVAAERAALMEGAGDGEEAARAEAALEAAQIAAEEAEGRALTAEEAHVAAREAETAMRGPLAEAERKAQRLETEARTLAKLLDSGASDLWPPVVEAISVAKGYEAALGAALGDDLDASTNPSAPAHWRESPAHADDPALPPGVESLATRVAAPAALARRLAQIGVVLRAEGAHLATLLKPGQRLVSKEGDLWRWDGLVAAAEAPTPAARRLAEKNRLGDLRIEAEAAREAAEAMRERADAAQTALRQAAEREAEARQAQRAALRALEEARGRAAAAERKRNEVASRLSALDEATTRLEEAHEEAQAKMEAAAEALAGLVATAELATALEAARATAARDRAEVAEARAAAQGLAREAELRQRRLAAIAADRVSWGERQARAVEQIEAHELRATDLQEERLTLEDAPTTFLAQRRALIDEIDSAEAQRKEASDKRAEAEAALTEADRQARGALDAMAEAREARARSEAQAEALRQRVADIAHQIATDLETEPAELPRLAGVDPDASLPDVATIEKKLESLKADRERLGAVNLRADDELVEVETSRESLVTERDDLNEAIRKLRGAIQSLNREGRERLLAAFDIVNGHFKELFTTLFGGGEAELQLVESDDPLEAGLEILARPPGKKPQTMSLLSGGEQALTAMSLIFAVFLTNPSPICVLDEVDAPLDDSNVERFCDLLEAMRKKTDTRFVTITHNPITMARMDRLFGVTMAERGVSQLVSVDLAEAERFLEAS